MCITSLKRLDHNNSLYERMVVAYNVHSFKLFVIFLFCLGSWEYFFFYSPGVDLPPMFQFIVWALLFNVWAAAVFNLKILQSDYRELIYAEWNNPDYYGGDGAPCCLSEWVFFCSCKPSYVAHIPLIADKAEQISSRHVVFLMLQPSLCLCLHANCIPPYLSTIFFILSIIVVY